MAGQEPTLLPHHGKQDLFSQVSGGKQAMRFVSQEIPLAAMCFHHHTHTETALCEMPSHILPGDTRGRQFLELQVARSASASAVQQTDQVLLLLDSSRAVVPEGL